MYHDKWVIKMSVASQVSWLAVIGSHGEQIPFAPLIPNRARLVLTFPKTRSLGMLVSGPTGLALVDKVACVAACQSLAGPL